MTEAHHTHSERVPPHDTDAERTVLAAMLLDNACIDDVAETLGNTGDERFYAEAHRMIYCAAEHLYETCRAVDVVLMRDELERAGCLNAIGGMDYLTTLVESLPSASNARHYAAIVRDHAVRRDLITACNAIQATAYDPPIDMTAADIVDTAEARVFALADSDGGETMADTHTLVTAAMDRLDAAHKTKGTLTGLPTGFTDLDDQTAGLQDGELILLAARPSVGKTALAFNIAEHLAVDKQIPVAAFSLEMSRSEMGHRLVCARAQVNTHDARRGYLPDSDWPKVAAASAEIDGAPLYVDDDVGLSPMRLRAKARRLKSSKGIRLVIVDYLQLMTPPAGCQNICQEVSKISRSLKLLARELNTPVLALSQLNRESVYGKGRPPRLSDLRESGSLEQDADVVLLLHRPSKPELEEHDLQHREGLIALNVAKQRNGPVGTSWLAWRKECVRFGDAASERPSAFVE